MRSRTFTAVFMYLNHTYRRGARPCAPTAWSIYLKIAVNSAIALQTVKQANQRQQLTLRVVEPSLFLVYCPVRDENRQVKYCALRLACVSAQLHRVPPLPQPYRKDGWQYSDRYRQELHGCDCNPAKKFIAMIDKLQNTVRDFQEINYPISRPSKRLSLPLLPAPCPKSDGIFFYLEVPK